MIFNLFYMYNIVQNVPYITHIVCRIYFARYLFLLMIMVIFDKFLGKGGIGIVLQFKYKGGLIAVKASYPWKYSKVENMKSAAKYIENNKHICGDNFKYILEFKYIGKGSEMRMYDNKSEYFSSEIMEDDLFNYVNNYLPRADNNYHKENTIKIYKMSINIWYLLYTSNGYDSWRYKI